MTPDLSVDLAGLRLINPVMSASGTFGFGREFAAFVDPAALGAVVTKGVSLQPRTGNPPPRIVETPAGMLNAIGLQNPGLDVFLQEKLPWLLERGATVVVNVLGETVEEYAALASALSASAGVGMLEVNVSCPNVREGGLAFGQNPRSAADVVAAVAAEAGGLPVMVKLTPMAADISEIAFAVVEAGAQALSLINTVPAMAVDLASRRPVLANIIGGLSGPAVKPLALRLVWEVSRAVSVPVVGIGGIMNSEDALEFMLAGASAVQVGTANFVRPRAALDVLEGIRAYMIANDLADLSQIIGRLETG